MEKHILKELAKQSMAGKTFQLSWEEWKEHCVENNIDPHENREDGVDLGGGDSYTVVCREDPPKEERISELRSKCCGARVYYDYKKTDDFQPQRYIGLRHVAHCTKCHKPTEIEEKEEANHDQ